MLYTTLTLVLLATFSAQLTSAKTVLSHFMLQNSYAYNLQQWKTDIAAAQQIGLDGFALNWLPPDCSSPGLDWQVARIDDAFTAAEDMNFNLIFSFDMSYSVCDTYWNVTFMESMITKYAGSSAALRWNTNLVVSTYGGDTVDEYGNEFFQSLKNSLKAAGHSISLVPALTSFSEAAQSSPVTSAAKLISEYTAIDGYFNCKHTVRVSGLLMLIHIRASLAFVQ